MKPIFLKDCPFCDPASAVHSHLLEETAHFRVVCERHPLTAGHILVVSKSHFSCIGEYPAHVFRDFSGIFLKVIGFLKREYGSGCAFERGQIHRPAFHSNVHFIPFAGTPDQIVTEGWRHVVPIHSLEQLRCALREDNGYLFFFMKEKFWLADSSINTPRFFRNRFASVLGAPGRGDWEKMSKNKELMALARLEIQKLADGYRSKFVQ